MLWLLSCRAPPLASDRSPRRRDELYVPALIRVCRVRKYRSRFLVVVGGVITRSGSYGDRSRCRLSVAAMIVYSSGWFTLHTLFSPAVTPMTCES
ncbi:hypothetical protein BRADI_1g50060v3 [Brachypodium distachyon]|uniref:Uncharacterized protein n=1 Tax=Brachypodium distachyon TaxID=15368 RepID=A0A2K2DQP2_BRADI|nr:hypothetical protein BRADI_1g50060v3 [Brachypodium distachyon]